MSWERGDRQTVYVPHELHAVFRSIAARRDHQMSTLLACAYQDAMRRAIAGLPLPRQRWDGPVREWPQLRWRQSRREFNAWTDLIVAAGGYQPVRGMHGDKPGRRTVSAANVAVYSIILAFVEAYIAADGDLTKLGQTPAVA